MAMTRASPYDAIAPGFDRHRTMPDGVAGAIRSAILASTAGPRPPRLLDLGAGTGRIGWPFVAAGDDYVRVGLSDRLLCAFKQRLGRTYRAPPPARRSGRAPF